MGSSNLHWLKSKADNQGQQPWLALDGVGEKGIQQCIRNQYNKFI